MACVARKGLCSWLFVAQGRCAQQAVHHPDQQPKSRGLVLPDSSCRVCERTGQLLVWEWRSQTYLLKQQGHSYDVSAVAFSPDGSTIATGADDNKVLTVSLPCSHPTRMSTCVVPSDSPRPGSSSARAALAVSICLSDLVVPWVCCGRAT